MPNWEHQAPPLLDTPDAAATQTLSVATLVLATTQTSPVATPAPATTPFFPLHSLLPLLPSHVM
jgi:hypothetical protein